MMWQGPGFSRMFVVSSLRTPIKHTPYLQPQRQGQLYTVHVSVSSFLGFCTLWLTFCEHERRQRWNSCPGIPQRIYFLPGGCDAPHWLSNGGRLGATGLPSRRHPPWDRKRRVIGHVGKDWPLEYVTRSICLSTRAMSQRFSLKVAEVTSYISVRPPDQYFNQHTGVGKDTQPFWTIGPRCSHSHS